MKRTRPIGPGRPLSSSGRRPGSTIFPCQPPDEALTRLAPYAAQAVRHRNPSLLSAILNEVQPTARTHSELARSMLLGFSIGQISERVGGIPWFGPTITPQRIEDTISGMLSSAPPLYEEHWLAPKFLSRGATRPPNFRGPSLRVYSNPKLIPISEGNARVIDSFSHVCSSFWREATIDLRNIQFPHSLSEGLATKLVAKKIRQMREKLSIMGQSPSNSNTADAKKIMQWLTQGDKNSEEGQIRVGRYNDSGRFLILNGHRRITSLCILALQGVIPLDWLTRIPVWHHEINSPEAIDSITAGVTLNTHEVLAEITIGPHCAAEALDLLRFLPKRKAKIKPLDISKIVYLYQWDLPALILMQERGVLGIPEKEFYLKVLNKLATSKIAPDYGYDELKPLLERLEKNDSLVPHLWSFIYEHGFNKITAILLYMLYKKEPQMVLSYIRDLLSGEITRPILFEVLFLFANIGDDKLGTELIRFSTHPDPKIRDLLLGKFLTEKRPAYLRRLVRMYRTETDPSIIHALIYQIAIEVSETYRLQSEESDSIKYTSKDRALWQEVADILRENNHQQEADLALEFAGELRG